MKSLISNLVTHDHRDILLERRGAKMFVRHKCPFKHAVRPSHAHWLAPLAKPCPPALRRALEARFVGDRWPTDLETTLVVRPGLGTRPDLPEHDAFFFLNGILPGSGDCPRTLYQTALTSRGIPFASDFQKAFQTFFGGHIPSDDPTVLLFPGAGHPDKTWPLAQFETVSDALRHHHVRPVFVLGPAEQERGITPQDGEIVTPADMQELAMIIRSARCVIGPDCGPLHLAGMHGVPGIALFGPTSPIQWGPIGLNIVTAGLPCSPCTGVTSGDFAPGCPRPLPCMDGISVTLLLERLAACHFIASRS